MARKFNRPVARYPKPHGFVMPKPSNIRPGTINDKRQMAFFDPPKRTASFVEQPLSRELAARLLDQRGGEFTEDECGVLRLITAGFSLKAEDRQTLNSIFAKLGAPS